VKFFEQTLIENFSIAITIAFENAIRINRDPVFLFHSDPDFSVSNAIATRATGPLPAP